MSKRDPKELILDAALATFAKLGVEGTTTNDIRARAGVSNGALFHHFPSKDAIAEALYLRGIASYQDGLLCALERNRGETARTMIKAAVHHHLAWVEARRDLAWFMYERGRPDWQPAHGAAVRKLNRSTAVHVKDWIAPLAATGVIRNLPLAVLAACVIGPSHFIARRWLSGLIQARPTSFTEALADAAWAALAPGKPQPGPERSHRISPAAQIEAAAREAACSACPAAAEDEWITDQLSMCNLARAADAQRATAQVQSVRLQAGGCLAVIDVDLVDTEGFTLVRGHVVCLRDADHPGDAGVRA